MKLILMIGLLLCLLLLTLLIWRQLDHRSDRAEMDRLINTESLPAKRFSIDMVEPLPEPARRFFRYAINDGALLYTVADIQMQGKFSLGNKDSPNYMPMSARQILAAPAGFIWKTKVGKGLMQMSGSDSADWTRFWINGLIPVVRAGGTADHLRSAFGRYIAEAAFWIPAALLPRAGVTWEGVDDNTARVTVEHNHMKQAVELKLADNGQPVEVKFSRWTNANPDKAYRLQPFGGYLSGFREFHGIRVPTHIEAGNFFDTADYFPFFIADVTTMSFPASAGVSR